MTHLHDTPMNLLLAATRAIEAGRVTEARALLRRDTATTAAGRLDALILGALEARLGGDTSGGNLYAGDDREGARMIAAFAQLAERTPLVRFGYVAANQAILAATAGAPVIHVVDIGIGTGIQWQDLIDRLAERGDVRLIITGIDVPDEAGEVARGLAAAGERLHAHARARGLDLEFRSITRPIEGLEAEEILGAAPGEVALAINASLALHHVDADAEGAGARDHVLRRLAAMGPRVLTLVEAEADHNHAGLSRRVAAARRHYGLVFAILDRVLGSDPAAREALERGFFGREVLNIIAHDGVGRVERHEPFACWRTRLEAAGFSPRALDERPLAPALGLRGDFSIGRQGPALQLCFDREPVLSCSAWEVA